VNANARYRDIKVLWGFVAASRLPLIEACAKLHQIRFYVATSEELPAWTQALGERVFLLDFDYGEYEGPLGCLNGRNADWRPRPDQHTVMSHYAKKHPTWSRAKLERAVNGRMAAFARGPALTHGLDSDEQARQYVAFLREATLSGPLVFLLTDDDRPLASGAGSAVRESPLRVDAVTLTEEQLVRLPAWTVLIVGS
jgi:hypothetical protein